MSRPPRPRPVAALFGAIDRFNYGDLLFPIVLRALVERASPGRFGIECVGLRRSRLQRAGGLPTHGIRWLLDPENLPEGSAVIVAGGEVLGADWDRLWSYLMPEAIGDFAYGALRRAFGEARLNEFIKARFSVPWKIPFVVDPASLPGGVRVLFNGVGGVGLLNRPGSWSDEVAAVMGRAAYRSVRDRITQQVLEEAGLRTELVPDCVVVLSDLFPRAELEARARASTRSLLAELSGKFVCFQCNRYFGVKALRKIAAQLDAIAADTGWRTVLLPLGQAAGHSDRIALRQLAGQMTSDPILPRRLGVFDLAALIAHSRMFVGTSLHGVITAISYGTPYAALEKAAKQVAFIETWARPPFDEAVGFDAIHDVVRERATGFDAELSSQAEDVKGSAHAGFADLHRALCRPTVG